MDTAWRTIDCSSMRGSLAAARGALLIRPTDQDEVSVPVDDVAVALVGPGVTFTSGSMHRLLDADVVVLFCDWRGVPEGASYPWRAHTRVGARQRAQAELSEPRRKNAWGRIVKAKISGQASVLAVVGSAQAPRLRSIAKDVRSGDPDNAEGTAARIYWSQVFGTEAAFGRDQDGGDGRNSCLNYGYAIVRAEAVRAVVSAGLSPTLGLFHRGRSNYFNLADDLMEPFRPVVDQAVASLPSTATPDDREVKHYLVDAVTSPFNADGETLPTVIERLAQHLGQYVEGDRKLLDVPVWDANLGRDDGGR